MTPEASTQIAEAFPEPTAEYVIRRTENLLLEPSIDVVNVTARFGRIEALKGVTFHASRGICALLGPNGAGKTTLMACILGQKAYGGQIGIQGNAHVGMLPQRFQLAPGFTVAETVAYAAWAQGMSKRDSLIASGDALTKMSLDAKAGHRVRTLSGGERQRLGVACAISTSPSVLLLDEPTVGLDPSQRSRFRSHLAEIAKDSCVIVSTHLLQDVEIMADKVVVLNSGRVLFSGSLDDLRALGGVGRGKFESELDCAYRNLSDGVGADSN